MSEYTPTTAEVSRRYMLGAWEESGDTSGDDVAQFDRWLASVKADAYRMGYNKATADIVDEGRSLKVKANAWDEGRDCSGPYPVNPYRGEQA
jgi:hypothetical protein